MAASLLQSWWLRSTGSVLERGELRVWALPVELNALRHYPAANHCAMETEESIRYGLYAACLTQQQTVSKAALEAKLGASSVLARSWALLLTTEGRPTSASSSTAWDLCCLNIWAGSSLTLPIHTFLLLFLSPRCYGCLPIVWLSPCVQESVVVVVVSSAFTHWETRSELGLFVTFSLCPFNVWAPLPGPLWSFLSSEYSPSHLHSGTGETLSPILLLKSKAVFRIPQLHSYFWREKLSMTLDTNNFP